MIQNLLNIHIVFIFNDRMLNVSFIGIYGVNVKDATKLLRFDCLVFLVATVSVMLKTILGDQLHLL